MLGQEVCYDDLKTILDKTDVDIEYFIHGAMCIHYSGRCMLSNYFHVVMLIGVDVHNHVAGTMIYIKVIKKLIKMV